jgi:hypothetical protein
MIMSQHDNSIFIRKDILEIQTDSYAIGVNLNIYRYGIGKGDIKWNSI